MALPFIMISPTGTKFGRTCDIGFKSAIISLILIAWELSINLELADIWLFAMISKAHPTPSAS
jgi:hypothetical protein